MNHHPCDHRPQATHPDDSVFRDALRASRTALRVAPAILSRSSAAVLAALALFGFNPQALASTQTWNSTGASTAWSSTTNWGGNVAPGSTTSTNSTDLAVFNSAVGVVGTTINPIVIDQAAQNIGGITFTGAAGSFTIGTALGNSLLLTGGGTIQITGLTGAANAFETINAPLVVEAGTAALTTYNFTNSTASGTTAAGTGTLVIGGPISGGTAGPITLNFNGTNTNSNTVSGNISNGVGTVSVAKSAAGTWVFSGTNTYTGATTVSGGILEFATENALYGDVTASWSGANIFVQSGDTLALQVGSSSPLFVSSDIDALLANMDITSSGTSGFENGSRLGFDTSNSGGSFTYSTAISNPYVGGTMGITKLGAGTLTLAGASTYSGPTTITSGTIQAAGASIANVSGPLGLNSPVTIANAANAGLNITGFDTQIGSLAGGGTAGGVVTLGSNTLTVGGDNTNPAAFAGTITGAGALVKSGFGVETLSGSNSYTGTTTISGGAIDFLTLNSLYGGNTASWNGSNIIVQSGGTLGVELGNAPNFTFATLTSLLASMDATSSPTSGFENGSAFGIDTSGVGGFFNYNLPLTNAAAGLSTGFSKLGTGTLLLTAANTYTGPTTIFGGTLEFTSAASLYNDNTANWTAANISIRNGGTIALDIGDSAPYLTSADLSTLLTNLYAASTSTTGFAAGSALAINTAPSVSGTVTYSGPILNGPGAVGFTKLGAGTLRLNGTASNTYTGPTTISAGTLVLDLSNLTASTNFINSASALTLGGGKLSIIGASGSTSQTFPSTTLLAGQSVISASSAGTIPTINLGTLTGGIGNMVVFNGPAYNSGSSTGIVQGGNTVPATAIMTATSNTTTSGLLTFNTAGGPVPYATVGLYDYAALSTGTASAATTGTLVGGSQIPGFYTVENAGLPTSTFGLNVDLTANATLGGNSSSQSSADNFIRINLPQQITITTGRAIGDNSVGSFLITPNVGAFNTLLVPGTGTIGIQDSRNSAGVAGLTIWQNDTAGQFQLTAAYNDSKAGGSPLAIGGIGTTVLGVADGYTGATFLTGGYTVISLDGAIGNAGTAALLNLNGGTLVGNASFVLDNGGVNARPVALGTVGGGLAATAGNTITVDGVVSGGAGSGPLVIGIPASSANNNTAGLLPGTGTGTANLTGTNATGTVALSAPNTYTGGTVVDSGTLQINGIFALGGANYGGITFNGGALRYATSITNGSSDLTSLGSAGVTIASGGGTIDTNGNAVTYGTSIGNGGSGGLTVLSSNPGGSLSLNGSTFAGPLTLLSGSLNLSGNNIYTGATTINGGTLTLKSGASLNNTAISIASGATMNLQGNTIGTTGAKMTLSGGSILSLQDNAVDTVTLNSTTGAGATPVFTVGGASAANLFFDLNNAASDELILNNGITAFGSSGGKIFIDDLNNLTPNQLTYTLISDPNGGIASGIGTGAFFSMGNTTLLINGISYSLSLQSTSTALQLLLTAASVDFYWTGNTSSSWSSISNFATDHAGGTAQTGNLTASSNVFLTVDSPNAGNTASQTLDGNYVINSLSFTGSNTGAASTAITLGSGTGSILTINAANGFGDASANSYAAGTGLVVQPGSAAHTISANIGLGNSQTWDINNSATNPLAMSGVISDAQGSVLDSLTVNGTGELILSATNTYDGGTTVSGGTLMLAPGGSLLSTGALTVSGSGTFDLGSNAQTIGTLLDGGSSKGTITASTGAAILTIANSANSTFSGTITDNFTNNNADTLQLSLQGSANVVLSGSNSFTGGTDLISGNLTAASNYALGNTTSQSTLAGLTFDNIGTVNAFFTSANPQLAAVNMGGLSTGTANIILGNIAGSGSATTLHVGLNGGNSTFTGVISDQTATKGGAIGNLEVDGGGFLKLGGANTFTGTTVISGSGALGASEIEIDTPLALQNSTLNYNNQGGILSFGASTAATLAGLTGAQNLAVTNASSAGVTLTIGNRNLSTNYTGNLSGAGGLVKIGTGTFESGSGTTGGASYTGGTTINAGTLIIGGTGNITDGTVVMTGANGTSTLIVQDDAVINSTAAMVLDTGGGNGFPANCIVTVTGTGSLTVAGFAFGNATARIPTGVSLTVAQQGTFVDHGTFDLMDTDGGTSTVGGTALNLNGGLVAVQNFIQTNLGNVNSTTTINFNGGTLEALANDPSGSTFLPAFVQSSAKVLAGGAIINPNGFTITIAQSLTSGTANDGGLTETGSGTLILSGSNNYTGPTRINGGALVISNSNAITNSAAITFGGGKLQYNSATTTDYSTKIVNSTAPIRIDLNGQSINFANSLASSNVAGFSLEDSVANVGSLTLTAPAQYGGATAINTGATLILGAGASLPNPNVSVNGTLLAMTGNGGILAGAGTFNLGSSSTLSTVDGAIGGLTINGGVNIGGAAAANLNFDINTDAGTADLLTITGPLTFGAGGGSITLTDIGATTLPATGTQLTLITDASGLGAQNFTLSQASLFIDGQSYVLTLGNSTANSEIVTLTLAALNYYWTGNTSASWSSISNFSSDPAGTLPRAGSLAFVDNVFLTANTATNLNQTLDGNYTINSLSFTGTGTTAGSTPVTLSNGTGTALTLDPTGGFSDSSGQAYPVGTGLVVQPGAASDTLAANINLKVSQTWDVNNSPSNPLIVTGVIADGSTLNSLTKTGTGTMILETPETYDGGTIVNQGTLTLGVSNTLLTTAPLTVSGTGTLDLAGNNQTLTSLADGGSTAGAITTSSGTSVLTFVNTSPVTFRGAFNDTNSVNGSSLSVLLEGSSNVTLSGSGNFTGGTNLVSGNLTVGNNYALGNPNSSSSLGLQMNPVLSGTVTAFFTSSSPNIAALNNPGAGTSNIVLGVSVGTSTTLNIGAGNGGLSTFTGTISDLSGTAGGGVGSLNVYGGATLTLAGTNTYTGTTTITGASSQLILTNSTAIENSIYNTNGGGILNIGGMTTLYLGGLTGNTGFALTNAGTPLALTIGNGNDSATFNGNLSDAGSLTKTGTGTQVLNDATYTGATIVENGGLTFSGSTNLTTHLDIASQLGVATVTITGAGTTVTSTGGLYITSPTGGTGGATIFGNHANLTVINGAQLIAMSDTTGRAISYGNGTAPGGGRPAGTGTFTIGSAGDITTLVQAQGSFDLFNSIGGGTVGNLTVNLLGGTLEANNILKTIGAGSQTSTFNFNGGVLEALNNDPTGSTFLPALGGLTANVQPGGAFINSNGFNITIAQALVSGTATDGGLTKLGAGNLTLSGSDNYFGPTNVNTGRLIVSGSVAALTRTSAVNIAAGATLEADAGINNAVTIQVAGRLSGAGGVVGPVNVASTGTFAPGFSVATPAAPGVLTANGNVTLANESTFSIRLGVAAQMDSDSLTIASIDSITLNNAILRITDGTAFIPASEPASLVYVLVNGGASGTGSGTDVFGNAPTSGSIVTDTLGDTFAVYYAVNASNTGAGSDIDLVSIAPVPEPGTWAELLAGVAMLCVWRRSRRKSV